MGNRMRNSVRNTATHQPLSGQCVLTLGALALAVSAALACGPAAAVGQLGSLDIVSRNDGQVLPVYPGSGRNWVVGTPGQEYSIRYCNKTPGRVLAVMSVDGVNVVSGDTAAPSQSGYVLSAYECADIQGWRKNLARTAAFYFTELPDAYATRTGRPENVGVIGVAVFRERQPAIGWRRPYKDKLAAEDARADAPSAKAQAAEPGRYEADTSANAESPRASGRRGGTRSRRPRAVDAGAGADGEARHRSRTKRGFAHADGPVRPRERGAERDGRDLLRPSREPDRDGHPAPGRGRALRQSLPRVDALRSRSSPSLTVHTRVAGRSGASHTRGRCPRPRLPALLPPIAVTRI